MIVSSFNYILDSVIPTTNLILTLKVKNITSPSVINADLKYNKDLAVTTDFDDSLKNQLGHAYPVLQGGVSLLNGQTYPGLRFSDGTGKMINYRAMLVMISNDVRETNENTPNSYIWPQVRQALLHGWTISNHDPYHDGGPNPWDRLKNFMLGQQQVWDATGYKMIINTTPSSDDGNMYTGKESGALAHRSTYQEGNDDVMFYDKGTPAKVVEYMNKFPNGWFNFGRQYFGDNFDNTQVQETKDYIDYGFNQCTGGNKFIIGWLTHGPGDPDNLAATYQYIADHPQNTGGDRAWVTSAGELIEFFHVKKFSTFTQELIGDILTITFDQSAVNRNIKNRDVSLLCSGFEIDSIISSEGWDDVTVNPTTGLINLYKIDSSQAVNPADQVLPAQIVSLVALGNNVLITYDKAITQSMIAAYTISGKTITAITGSGLNWTLTCNSAVSNTDTLSYRMYNGTNSLKGDAVTIGTGLRVCDYINYPIIEQVDNGESLTAMQQLNSFVYTPGTSIQYNTTSTPAINGDSVGKIPNRIDGSYPLIYQGLTNPTMFGVPPRLVTNGGAWPYLPFYNEPNVNYATADFQNTDGSHLYYGYPTSVTVAMRRMPGQSNESAMNDTGSRYFISDLNNSLRVWPTSESGKQYTIANALPDYFENSVLYISYGTDFIKAYLNGVFIGQIVNDIPEFQPGANYGDVAKLRNVLGVYTNSMDFHILGLHVAVSDAYHNIENVLSSYLADLNTKYSVGVDHLLPHVNNGFDIVYDTNAEQWNIINLTTSDGSSLAGAEYIWRVMTPANGAGEFTPQNIITNNAVMKKSDYLSIYNSNLTNPPKQHFWASVQIRLANGVDYIHSPFKSIYAPYIQ